MDVEGRYGPVARLHHALSDPHRVAVVELLRLSDRTPGELARETELPLNLLAHHLGVLEAAGLVVRRRSAGDGRRRYVRLRHEALDGFAAARVAMSCDRVLFLCTRNAARSQIAAALWRGRTGRAAESAGAIPGRAVHPLAVAIAGARGVDLSAAAPHGYDDVSVEPDLVVTVCDRALESGVPFAGVPHLHWSIDDPVPVGTPAAFARAYDEVAERIEILAGQVAA